jgi:uncharacterized repeat protein (TIGR03803 family)
MKSSLPFAVPTVRLCIVVLLLGFFSPHLARGQVSQIYEPRSVGAEAQTASGVRSRRGNAKSQVQNGPEQIPYTFQGGSDGGTPSGTPIFDPSGRLYGVTQFGGGGACSTNGNTGCGTVFKLSPNSSGSWTESIIYSFQGGNDGAQPSAGLIFDQAGNLYGTTLAGGVYSSGTVFELSPNGGGPWTETILYSFGSSNSDGAEPQGLIFDKSGNLYGTTLSGGNHECDHDGSASCGTVFELSPDGSGGWAETIIFSFPNGDGGGFWPNPGLIFDQSGNLYGTTSQGGAFVCMGSGGCGTVFELSPSGGGGWTETLLYSFGAGNDGISPGAGMTFDQSGNLYGTTLQGGPACVGYGGVGLCGTVFKLSPSKSGGWTETILYSFRGGGDGATPASVLIFDQAGNLYGTTALGGEQNTNCGFLACGAVFELTPSGSGGWTETILYRFQGGNDGSNANGPPSAVIFGRSGNLYGTTSTGGGTGCNHVGCGVVFEISPDFAIGPAPGSSSSSTITPGKSATFNLMVTPALAFRGTVSLTCSITPVVTPAPSCTLPGSVNVTGGAAAPVMVTVATTAPGTAGTMSSANFPSGARLATWMLILFASGLLFVNKQGRLSTLAAPIIVLASIAMAGCGSGGSSSPTSTPGTPAGTYTVTVNGSSGSLNHSTTLTVVVQ